MKITKLSKTYFFEDKPLFGLDIGYRQLRVMQLDSASKSTLKLKAYGTAQFDAGAIKDGVIIKPEVVAKALLTMYDKALVGEIDTNRVAASLPASRAFTRSVQLPIMGAKDIDEAVRTEASQYLTAGIDQLYLDYATIREDDEGIEVFVIAMPRSIVDSYLVLARMLGLEIVLFDTSIGANARLYAHDDLSSVPSVLVDFGTKSTDITVFNHGLVATGTVAFGGDDVTDTITKTLHVTPREAVMLKSNYGLSSSVIQKQVTTALGGSLEQLIKEIRRSMRYYEQRYPNEPPIGQIVTMGGGANMPGLASYLTDQLRLAVRSFDPLTHIDFGQLKAFNELSRMSYSTVAGLAATNPAEIFA